MGEGVEPARERAVAYGPTRVDEVTLRDLYLTFKAGLPLIAVVVLICAVAAFVAVTSKGISYSTAATVSVAPPGVGSSALSGLDLTIPVGLDFDVYRAMAFDGELVKGVVRRVDTHLTDEAAIEGASVRLLGALGLRSRTPASQTRGHVTVEHTVSSGPSDSEKTRAVRIANDWATATATAVSEVLATPINDAIASLSNEVATRKTEFDAASDAWSEFLAVDERRSLNARLDALTELDSAQRARLAELESTLAGAIGRATALEGTVRQRLTEQDAVSELLLDQLALLISEQAAVQAERDQLMEVVAHTLDDSAALRARLTDLEGRASTLQRDLAAASMTYYRVAPTVPTLQLQRELVADSARVTVQAVVPLLPEPRGRLVAVVAAAAASGLLTTLFVFLRAAVRDPEHGPVR